MFKYLSRRDRVFFYIGWELASRDILQWRLEIYFLKTGLDLSCETCEIMELMHALWYILTFLAWKEESERRIHHAHEHGGKKLVLVEKFFTRIAFFKNGIP